MAHAHLETLWFIDKDAVVPPDDVVEERIDSMAEFLTPSGSRRTTPAVFHLHLQGSSESESGTHDHNRFVEVSYPVDKDGEVTRCSLLVHYLAREVDDRETPNRYDFDNETDWEAYYAGIDLGILACVDSKRVFSWQVY